MLTIASSFSKFSLKKLTSKEYLEFKKQLQLPIDSEITISSTSQSQQVLTVWKAHSIPLWWEPVKEFDDMEDKLFLEMIPYQISPNCLEMLIMQTWNKNHRFCKALKIWNL